MFWWLARRTLFITVMVLGAALAGAAPAGLQRGTTVNSEKVGVRKHRVEEKHLLDNQDWWAYATSGTW